MFLDIVLDTLCCPVLIELNLEVGKDRYMPCRKLDTLSYNHKTRASSPFINYRAFNETFTRESAENQLSSKVPLLRMTLFN